MGRQIRVDIIGDSASLERAFSRSKLGAEGLNSTIGRLSVGFGSLLKTVVVVDAVQKAIEGLTGAVHLGVTEFKEHATVTAQTEAALKSTGGIANITAKQIDALGLALSNLSGIDDEVVQGGENVLLAFQNIRNFAGKGNQIFTDATKATVDFAIRSGRSVQAAGVAIGRALQDPAKAAGSLRRAYVVLTSSEKAAISSAVAHGDILKGQRLIVADLERRYGGAAEAAGKTLPGALNVLRDRFKDLAGSGIGLIAPALTRATRSLTEFVVRFTAAQGARAKFNLVFDGLENVGRDLFNTVEKQIRSIDFAKIGDEIGRQLARIDWRTKIAQAGRAAGTALVASLDALRNALARVDWNQVGQELVRGVSLAIAALVDFLAHVNWRAVAGSTLRLLEAAFKASGSILLGVGEALGKLVLSGITKGLDAAGSFIERKAVELVLKIIEPFTHLPGFLGGGPFQDMKRSLQKTLDQMAVDGRKGGHNIGAAVAAGIAAGIGPSSSPGRATIHPTLPLPPSITGPSPLPGITAAQRNTFFDNAIARILQRGGLGDVQQQIDALTTADGLISKRIAATGDVTRKLKLEDELLQNQAQIRQLNAQKAADALQKAQQAEQQALDRLTRLAEARNARQFKTLGLTAAGDQVTPGVRNLKSELSKVGDAIKGTFLDTSKTQSVLGNISKVLSGSLGVVGQKVRAQIKQILDGIDNQLKNHAGNQTRFRHTSTEALLAGLGLSPDTIRLLRQRLSQIGAGGTVPGQRSPAFALAGATTLQADLTVNLDGAKLAKNTTTHQVKQGRRRSSSRRN